MGPFGSCEILLGEERVSRQSMPEFSAEDFREAAGRKTGSWLLEREVLFLKNSPGRKFCSGHNAFGEQIPHRGQFSGHLIFVDRVCDGSADKPDALNELAEFAGGE